MFQERWIIDFMVYVYAISLAFSFADLLRPSKRLEQLSILFLSGVWVLQTIVLVVQRLALIPISASIDALSIYSWVLISFTLVMHFVYRMSILFFIANSLSFIMLAIHLFFVRSSSPVMEKLLLSELVFLHVTLAMMANAFFSLASIGAGLYLVNNYLLKQKKWNDLLRRLPSLDRLQGMSAWLLVLGTSLLLTAMTLGAIYAYQTIGAQFWEDAKVWSSLWVLALYAFILWKWARRQWHGRKLAWWTLLSLFAVLSNYIITRSGFSFHHWI
ncbi:cytochrome C assembly protein [Laceyella sacchari]|uniref:HemX family protein n=1 Tax=Laceyella tengchongensis TaxID=574699 RepID=A0AA46ADQ2_9BACL|nr:cytochrome c biogenesis protein CcsA [Laceyella tengchongensis]AUS08406.1 cytochrome C assembly protein [Laceyella sacchari]SMP07011.1 HemX family protein [Laceyella tengchongensis]